MNRAELKVFLLEGPQNPLAVIYAAYRQCYSSEFAAAIYEQEHDCHDKAAQFITRMVQSGHLSPLEHVSFTFAIEGMSRAATHQLVRHRIASYSQQSQRYVNEKAFEYVVPPSIAGDTDLHRVFVQAMDAARSSYAELINLLGKKGADGVRANEDARYVLPQAVETKIVVSMNCMELLHFFELRCCSRAQWEIRQAANKMLETCRVYLNPVFAHAGAKCETLGYCPEDKKFSCGRFPLKKEPISGQDAAEDEEA